MDISGKARRGGKKNRKIGRGGRRPGKARYNAEQRWLRNKMRKLLRHLKSFPKDRIAQKALARMQAQKTV